MNRLSLRSLFILLMVFGFGFLQSPVSAQEWQRSDVVSFLEDSLPKIKGTVVSKNNGTVFVELESAQPQTNSPVVIFRREVVIGEGGKQRVRDRELGQGQLKQRSRGLARLKVDESLYSRIRSGDRVRNRRYLLYVQDQTGSWSPRWSQTVEGLSAIRAVHTRQPESGGSPNKMELRLTADKLKLKRVGEWGTVAALDRSSRSRDVREDDSRSDEPHLRRITTVDRNIRDAAFVQLPGYSHIRLVQLATEDQVGFARLRDGELRSLRFHDLTGEVLSITPLPDRMDGLSSLPFLVVLRQSGSVLTRYYEYDLSARQMVRRWTAKNIWIEDVSGQLYGWRIGLNEPFKSAGYPVDVTRDSWDWRDKETPRIPPVTMPTAGQWVDDNFFRMNKDGNIDVFRNGERSHSSSQVYGGHPVSINARRGRIAMDRHPSFVAWSAAGEMRIVAANNQPEGIPYFKGLQSYEASRLYLLSAQSRFVDTIWESDRLAGYVAGIYPSGDQLWVVTVNPSEEFSVLHRLEQTEFDNRTR